MGRARAKKGMFLGETQEGELEIGQISANIDEIKSAKEIIDEIIAEYQTELEKRTSNKYNF